MARRPVARRPVGPKDREHVKSITYKAFVRVDATAKYSHSGEMLAYSPRLYCVVRWLYAKRGFESRPETA